MSFEPFSHCAKEYVPQVNNFIEKVVSLGDDDLRPTLNLSELRHNVSGEVASSMCQGSN